MSKFLIRKNSNGQFWFVLKSNNNKTILQSQMYTAKQHAETGIAAIKHEAALALIDDETEQSHPGAETTERYS